MTSSNWGENNPQDQQPFGGRPGGQPPAGPGGQPQQPDYPAPGGPTPFPGPAGPQPPYPGQPSPQQPYPQNPYPQDSDTQGGYPPQPPGQYGAPPPAAQPAKRSRKWLWFLLAIPLLLLLAIGGCTALLLTAVSGPIEATNDFVAELDEGDFQGAYASLCQSTRAATAADAWIADVEAGLGGEITGYNFTNVSVEGTGDGSTATVTGTIEVDGRDRDGSFGLVQEDGEWRVCTTS